LFSGIGGFHSAFHNSGARCVFASENNTYARKTYEANFKKHSPELFKSNNFAGDIEKINIKSIPDFDILCAGFPCQPFSRAGKRIGFEDMRGTLFFNVIEIIKEKNPKAFFLENVTGLLNHDTGNTFIAIKNVIADSVILFFIE
jgi:DNA (cytosine-5)-methyltransferase 1